MLNLSSKYKINTQNHKYYLLCGYFKKVSEERKGRQDMKVLTVKTRQVLWIIELKKGIGF